jgi:protein MpaA
MLINVKLVCSAILLAFFYPVSATAQNVPGEYVFGHSVNGRPLTAYIFGSGPNTTLIFGAFHNNEPASAAVVGMLRDYLAANPAEWDGRTIVLVPVTNPDSQFVQSRLNANGVDLNRNFPLGWEPHATAARYNPGSKAASEPETRAVMLLVGKFSPSKIVSIHQPFHCLNWNGSKGQRLAEAMSVHNRYPVTGDIGYPTPGSFGSYAEQKGIAIVTLEMPVETAVTCWRQNRHALLTAIRFEINDIPKKY